jgi:hypothetical protein
VPKSRNEEFLLFPALALGTPTIWVSWDNEILKVQLDLLRQQGMDLRLVGFSEEEFSALVDELEAANRLKDEDAAPEPPDVAVTEPGDLWELGNHLIIFGDATSDVIYQQLLDGH